jgi:signal transduction histidine kinase
MMLGAGVPLAFLDWFAGDGKYMTLVHCMGHDWPWIILTVALDLGVAAGYVVIAYHWWTNQRQVADSPARVALRNMRNIFLFCGLCGYVFIPIKMGWPAWRLYDVFMMALLYFTWRYAWGAKDLKVMFSELNRSKKLQEDLEISRAEAKRKSFFLNAISHDLRTPLNGMLLQASLAEISAEGNDQESLKAALGQIKESAIAASEMLTSFLDLGRLDSPDASISRDVVHVKEVAQRIIEPYQEQAQSKGLQLRVQDSDGLCVQTDRFKLERILNNLVQNAVKFTHAGEVCVGSEAHGNDVSIHVTDTGPGIAEEHREMLFQEFFQGHNAERDRSKGFGLGLAISRRLARQLGGDVHCTSEVGRGSRFTVHLPGAVAARPGAGAGPGAGTVAATAAG